MLVSLLFTYTRPVICREYISTLGKLQLIKAVREAGVNVHYDQPFKAGLPFNGEKSRTSTDYLDH